MIKKKDYWSKRRKTIKEGEELVSGMLEDWWEALVLEEARGFKRRRGRRNGRLTWNQSLKTRRGLAREQFKNQKNVPGLATFYKDPGIVAMEWGRGGA